MVKVKSELARGTKVKLIVPSKDQENEKISNMTKGESTANMPSDKKIRVMLGEDHEMMLKVLRRILDAEDDIKVVAEAADGEDAIALAKKTSPDVIVMDINLPGIDGIEATKRILSTISNVRVIGISLHDQQEVQDDMREAGATAYVSKKEALETLAATIRSEAKAMG